MKQVKNKLAPLFLSLTLLASCSSDTSTTTPPSTTSTPEPSTESVAPEQTDSTPQVQDGMMLDRSGTEFQIPESMDRIISTAPSNTEILIALGLGESIAVVDVYSSNLEGLSSDVLAVEFQSPDVEALIAAECDILIAAEHNMTGGEDPYIQVKEAGIPVVYIPTSVSFEAIYEDIAFLGTLTGTDDQADGMIEDMKNRIATVEETVNSAEVKTVYFEISPAPYLFTFGSGTFLNEAIELAGGVNIFAGENSWFEPSEESILSANPEVIITNATYMEDPTGEIMSRENWNEITAVMDEAVFAVDNDASSRPSHNVVNSLEEIAAAIHPDLFD